MLDVLQRNYLRIVLATRLTDPISYSKLYNKCGSIPLSKPIMRENFRCIGQVLRMKDDRLSNFILICQRFRAKRNAGSPQIGLEDIKKKS